MAAPPLRTHAHKHADVRCRQPSLTHVASPVPSRPQAERNNGRAAMMGITGMMVHNALGVDSLFPIVQ